MASVEAVFTLRDDMSRKLRAITTAAGNAERKINSLDRQINRLTATIEAATAATAELEAALVALGKVKATPEVGLDKSEFDRQLTAVQAELAALGSQRVTVQVDVQRGALDRAQGAVAGGDPFGDALKKSGANTYFKSRNLLMFSVAGLIGGLLGMSGGLVASLEAIVPLAGAATSGLLALGGAAGAAFAAVPVITEYAEKYKEISKAEAALKGARTDQERAEARLALADATKNLTKQERALYKEQQRLKESFDKLVTTKIRDRVYEIGTGFMRIGRDMLPVVAPTIDRFYDVFVRLTEQLRSGLMNPQNSAAMKQALAPLPSLFGVLAQATGEFGRILIGIGAGAGPEALRVFRNIRDYLGGKADYLTSARGIEHIQRYFALMAPILDKLVDSLGNIGREIAALSRVGRPFAIPFLRAFDEVIDALGFLLQEFTRVLGRSAPALFTSLSGFIRKITPGIAAAFDIVVRVITKALDLFNKLPDGAVKVGTIAGALLLITRRIPGLRTVLTLVRKIALIGAGKGLAGLGGLIGGRLGGALKGFGGSLSERGSSPANPLWVQMVAGGPGGPGVVGGGKGALGRLGGLAGRIGAGGLGATAGAIGAVVVGGAALATLISGEGPLGKTVSQDFIDRRQAQGGEYRAQKILEENPDLKNKPKELARRVLESIKEVEPEYQTAAAVGAQKFLTAFAQKEPEARGAAQTFLQGARTELTTFKDEVQKVLDSLSAGRAAAANAGGNGQSVMTTPRGPDSARGGIVASPSFRLVGERGPEAIVPLTNRARRDQIMREAGMGTGGRTRAAAPGPLVQITGVTINSGDDMASFTAQLESAVKRALANVPHASPEGLLA